MHQICAWEWIWYITAVYLKTAWKLKMLFAGCFWCFILLIFMHYTNNENAPWNLYEGKKVDKHKQKWILSSLQVEVFKDMKNVFLRFCMYMLKTHKEVFFFAFHALSFCFHFFWFMRGWWKSELVSSQDMTKVSLGKLLIKKTSFLMSRGVCDNYVTRSDT